jgi:glycine cleavage system H protein
VPRVEGYALPQSLFYHKGHTWVAPHDAGIAVVGIDEFASKLIGTSVLKTAFRTGRRVKQGERGWTLERGGKKLAIVSPLGGEIVEVNDHLVENPRLLSADPYGEGWLMKIRPSNAGRDVHSLLRGSAARRWMEACAAELRSMFSSNLGLVFQDGGMPLDGLADYLSMEEWDKVVAGAFAVNTKGSGE